MFMMHEDNVHYSLMVHKSHDLYDRLNKPLLPADTTSLEKGVLSKADKETKESEVKGSVDDTDVKKEVVKLRSKVKVLELQQNKTLEEMRGMRVKLEKLSNENRTLKEYRFI